MEGRKYPRDYLLAELKRVAKLLGKIPTMDEFRDNSKVSPQTLVARFHGWTAALASSGFDAKKARLTYQDIDLLEELRRVAHEFGRTPSCPEFDAKSKMSSSTTSQRFGGSWEKACIAAGLKPFVPTKPPNVVAGWNRGHRKLEISREDLQYLYDVEGLSASAIATKLKVSRGTVLRRMGEYEISVKRLHYSMPRETSIEAKMYAELERRGVTFVKQQVVDGLWVVDALVPGARVVIECDGEYWHSLPDAVAKDKRKDAYLSSRGFTVLRFPEAAINADVAGCVQRVVDVLIDRLNKK